MCLLGFYSLYRFSPSNQEFVKLVYFDMRILRVIKMYALLVNGCCGTVLACYYCLAGYNMLVLLVVFVRHVGMSKMFTLLDELDYLKLSTSLNILLVYPPQLGEIF